MTEIKDYRIDFVQRTKEILEEGYPHFAETDREVTFLLNCLLGLIVTISENENRRAIVFGKDIDDNFLKMIPDRIGFIMENQEDVDLTNKDLTALNVPVGHKADLARKNKLWLITKIRHGIAHQNIDGENENGEWVGVRLWNINRNHKDFEIVFEIAQLKAFAVALSDEYLKPKDAQ